MKSGDLGARELDPSPNPVTQKLSVQKCVDETGEMKWLTI